MSGLSPSEWAAVAFFVVVLPIAYTQLPKIWRHQTTFYDRPQWWWVWGDALWRAFARIVPISIFAMSAATLALLASAVSVPSVATWLAFVAVFLAGLAAAITLFNQPKFLVPPHLRQEPGALEEWYRALRRRLGPRRDS